jgi:glutamate 5-kinase
VVSAAGSFDAGAIIDVLDTNGAAIARGAVAMSHGELRELIGKRSTEIPEGASTMVFHRDEMVVFNSLV